MRILVHPGFHKTGTTSVQYGLERNAGVLGARVRVLQMDDFPDAIAAARRHTAQPAPRRLKKYATGFAAAVAPLDPGDPRPLLVTSEKLLGWIPGRKENWSYDATPDFTERLADVLEGHFGTGAELTFYFTTRAAGDWARSVYWQNLRSMRITEDFAAYHPRLERAAHRHHEPVGRCPDQAFIVASRGDVAIPDVRRRIKAGAVIASDPARDEAEPAPRMFEKDDVPAVWRHAENIARRLGLETRLQHHLAARHVPDPHLMAAQPVGIEPVGIVGQPVIGRGLVPGEPGAVRREGCPAEHLGRQDIVEREGVFRLAAGQAGDTQAQQGRHPSSDHGSPLELLAQFDRHEPADRRRIRRIIAGQAI